ncbi:MAG: FAD-linked oxidase C-terminal domain-containing protein, partial [Alphaproteobacteria bacterium]|nr:FAD-linked oxidase C-terminal domain-containing protein [Alphaproteobacteria bacterium]
WKSYMELVDRTMESAEMPFPLEHTYYVLIESQAGDETKNREAMEDTLAAAMERGLVADAVLAKSQAEVEKLWFIRDSSLEASLAMLPAAIFDVSVPISTMASFEVEAKARLSEIWPDYHMVMLGHIGDGNLHLLVQTGEEGNGEGNITPYDVIYELTGQRGGSVSAEHGIGLQKLPYLKLSRSEPELAIMRKLKGVFDPNGILNPGRVLGAQGRSYSAASERRS